MGVTAPHSEETEANEVKAPDSFFGYRHVQAVLLFSLVGIGYAMRVNLSVAIVAMTDSSTSPNPDVPTYDWNDKSVVLSSFFWGYIVLQVFAGQAAKNYGAKWFLVGAMLINSAACILIPVVADNLGSEGVMGCRVIQGLSQGFLFPSVHAMLGKWAPAQERSRLGTFIFSGSSFGTVVSIVVTGFIAASWAGWPASFYLFGGLGIAWVIFFIWLGSNSPAEHRSISTEEKVYIESSLGNKDTKEIPTPWKAIVTSLPMWGILVAHAGNNWGFATLATQIPTYLNKVMKFEMESNAFLSAAPYLALTILSFVFSPIADALINRKTFTRRTVRKIFQVIGTFIPALALIWLGFAEGTELPVTLLIIAVGMNAAVYCGFQINHIDLSPNHAGTLMGITNGITNIVSIIAPLLVQLIVTDEEDANLWRIIFITSAGLYLVCTTFYLFFGRAEIQPWNDLTSVEEKPKDNNNEILVETISRN